MLSVICESLKKASVDYIVREEHKKTAELFFIRRKLDMRRLTDVREWNVTVFVRSEKDGKPMVGSASAVVYPNTKAEDVDALCERLKTAAGYALNPAFDLYSGPVSPEIEVPSGFAGMTLEEGTLKMADAIMRADDGTAKGFVNTAEIFMCRTCKRVVSSTGTDAASVMYECNGEYVAQCKEPVDSEQYYAFRYLEPDTASLEKDVRTALSAVADRASAKDMPLSGEYDVVLDAAIFRRLFAYYTGNSSAKMIYPHYSSWTAGMQVQGGAIRGEALNLKLLAEEPFSDEGVPMTDKPLIEKGKLSMLHGPVRYCRYLGVEPTGDYRRIGIENGTVPFHEMKKNCIYPVSFSDFRCDPYTGNFGGEIRLGYVFDAEGRRSVVTGGSVSGDLAGHGSEMVFSLERYSDASYCGPFAVRIPGAVVAGREE